MSKIVFWSPLHGQAQTSNLHITALIMSLLYKKRILMMQTHFSMNNLEDPLVGRSMDLSSSNNNDLFQDIGLDAAVMYSKMNQLVSNILESCCITFPNTKLLLLPGTETKHRETFDQDIAKSVCRMVEQAEEYVDLVMIDTSSGKDEMSSDIISLADVLIINLSQSRYGLNKFFEEYGNKISDYNKVFFLFGSYDRNLEYNISNCRRKYSKYINKSNSSVIPYCSKYMDAQNKCNILPMIKEGLHLNKVGDIHKLKEIINRKIKLNRYTSEETYYFFCQACCSVNKIIDMLNVEDSKSHLIRSKV